jgi:hypothetical protein
MIERLFELAGINVDNDLLLEAAYDGMVNSLKKNFPDNIKDIDDNLKQAKTILKKQDRIVWYLKVLRAYLSNTINQVSGDYNFESLEKFNNDLFHYYGYNIGDIENTQLTNQNISELFTEFQKVLDTYKKSDKPPVPVKHGDYELIKCNDGTSWWFVDRGYCEEEGRSGKHCGNVVGKSDTTQRILSLRTPNHNVILTFVLLNNGYLGEMKAKGNQKPSEKYHPNIMQLLLNPIVKGIEGAGYAPDMNFSIFDLSEQNIKILINHGKQSFIANQIEAMPIEFLKAPDYIKANKEYQIIAINKLPVLKHIINNENDLNAWETAISENINMIIFAPDTLDNFEKRVYEYLIKQPSQLLKCPKNISHNFNILHALVADNESNIKYVFPTAPKYTELATMSIMKWGGNIQYVQETAKDYVELCKLSVKYSATAIKHIPSTLKEYEEICKYAVLNTGGALEYIDKDFKTFEICKIAISHWGYAIEYVPLDKFTDAEMYELSKLAVKRNYTNILYVPDKFKDKIKQEFNIKESVDFTYFQNL